VKYQLFLTGVMGLAMLGCKTGESADASSKREADRQAMRMDDLEKQRNALRTKVQQLEQENADLKKQRDELQAKVTGK